MPSPVSPVNPPTYLIVNSSGVGSLTVAPQQAAGPLMQVVITDSGAGYTPGVTNSISLTGGTGSGAVASIVVTGNVVTGVTITNNGSGYLVSDILSIPGGSTTATAIVTYLPSATDAITLLPLSTLELSGVNALNWGSNIWESLYRLTENFAAPTAPGGNPVGTNPNLVLGGLDVVPLIGQLWFDTTTQTLNVYTTSGWTTLETGAVSSITGTAPIVVTSSGGSSVINLNSAVTYGVLANSTITASNASIVNGDLGLYPGTSVTGTITVSGATNIDNGAASTALNDASNAFIAGNSLSFTTIASELGGTSPAPGYYTTGSSFQITGTLTLNGSASDVWVFQSPSSTLTTAASSVVLLTGGAQASNVYWLVGSSATFGVGSTFNGTVLAQASITDDGGSSVTGHLLALTAAVTLNNTTLTATPAGSGSGGVINISLAPSGVTAGSYTNANITVNADGIITTVSNGSSNTGTVTSVAATGSTGLVVSGSPITTTGTLTFTLGTELQGLSQLSALGIVQRTGTGTYVASSTPSVITGALGYTPLSSSAIIPIAQGGTGQTTASGAINALLPSQSGNSGDVLSTNGTTASWVNPNTLKQLPQVQYLSSNYTNATSTTTAIFPGITTTASNVYLIEWAIINSTSSNLLSLTIMAPASSTVAGFIVYAGTAESSYVQDPITAVNTAYGLIDIVSESITGHVVVVTSTTTGTLTLGAAMYSTGTTVTLTSGSWLRITNITG